ncbi:hypothetical protein CBOM_05763 [Ceraceosorus bombacis]|uniref:Uncharacterized protein n=1 Tax=Ceraceosorus bombacis TaxID=401625 RepID=A0A0P1BRH9_9BASI|nr:hypothetical protein CBOM_05763 [Ceraceosorus bombacis]
MEADPAQIRSNLHELSKKLWSRDVVMFNSTINAHFASSAIYKGHGLEISGASNVKHAAWLLNSLDAGPGAQIDVEDIVWDEDTSTATIKSTRFLRPRLFPLFTFASAVRSRITLHADGAGKTAQGKSGLDAIKDSGSLLYVTKWEDDWPLDAFVQKLPVFGSIERSVYTPIVTALVLLLSNLLFDLYARGASVSRSVLRPTAKVYAYEARSRLPPGVTKNLDQGFDRGSNLASGWIKSALNVTGAAARRPLRALERAAQTTSSIANLVSPIELPTPFIYALPKSKVPLSEPVPVRAQASLSAQDNSSIHHKSEGKRSVGGQEGEKLNAASPTRSVRAFPDDASVDSSSGRDAVVRVGATENAPAREINIPSRINNEAPQEEKIISQDPTTASGSPAQHSGKSLLERIEPEEIESAEKAQKKAQSQKGNGRKQPSKENVKQQPSSEKLKPKVSKENINRQPSKENLKRQASKENVSKKSVKANEASSPGAHAHAHATSTPAIPTSTSDLYDGRAEDFQATSLSYRGPCHAGQRRTKAGNVFRDAQVIADEALMALLYVRICCC